MTDLTALPPPAIVVTPDYAAELALLRGRLLAACPGLVLTEADPAQKLLELAAYRLVEKSAEFNDRAKGALLATAHGSDLDHLAALLDVTRLLVTPAAPDALPPRAAVWESDDALRRRAQMAMEGITTAGSVGAYIFHALSASPLVADATVSSPVPGTVAVTVLATEGDGTPAPAVLAAVAAALNADDVRPLSDTVRVQAAEIVAYDVDAVLIVVPGPDAATVLDDATAAVAAYTGAARRLGRDVALSGLYAALHRPGVTSARLIRPAADLVLTPAQAGRCTGVSIAIGAVDV